MSGKENTLTRWRMSGEGMNNVIRWPQTEKFLEGTTVLMENLYVIRCTNYLQWGMLERT